MAANAFDQFDNNVFDQFDVQNVNTDPIELPPDRTPILSGGLAEPSPRFSESDKALAAQGIDVREGADVPGARSKASFATNEPVAQEIVRQGLSKKLGQEVTLHKMPNGKTGFLDPETNRITPIDEAGLTFSDFAEFGHILPIVGAGAGEVVGGIPGAFGGGAAGEAIRRGVGAIIGANEESLESGAGASVVEGVKIGAFSAGTRAVTSLFKAGREFFKPRANLTLDQARLAAADIQGSQEVADAISKEVNKRFQPLTSQLSANEAIAGQQAKVGSSFDTAAAQRARIRENESVLDTFFETTTPTGGNAEAAGLAAQQAGRNINKELAETGENIAARDAERALSAALNKIPQASSVTQGRAIRAEVATAREDLKTAERQAYRDAESAYGLDVETQLSGVSVPVNERLLSTYRRFKNSANKSIFKGQASQKKLVTPRSLEAERPDIPFDSQRESFLQFVEKMDAAGPPKDKVLDLHQIQEAIRFLRSEARKQTGGIGLSPKGSDIKKMESALISARDEALKDSPEILEKILVADAAASARVTLVDKSLLSDVLRTSEQRGFILDKDIVSRIIGSGDAAATKQLHTLLSRNPNGVATLQKTFLQFYRNEVEREGILNLALHKEFVRKHVAVLDEVFPKQKATVAKFGEMGRVVEQSAKRAEVWNKALAKRFEGRIQSSNPEDIAGEFFTKKFSIQDAQRMKTIANAAGFGKQFDKAFGDEIRRQVYTGNSLSLTKLTNLVNNKEGIIKGYFGPQYFNNLVKLQKSLTLQRTAPVSINAPPPSTLIGVWRAIYAQPLSPQGVATTVVQRVRLRAVNKATAEILLDPKKLQTFISLAEQDIASQNVSGFLGAVGGAALIQEP